MVHIQEQTHAQKVAMYKKLSKEELITMLMENQRMVHLLIEQKNDQPKEYKVSDYPFGTPTTVLTVSN